MTTIPTLEAGAEASAPGPEAVTASPEPSTSGLPALTAASETGTTDPEAGTAGSEALTEASEANTRSLNLVKAKKQQIMIYTKLIRAVRKELTQMNNDGTYREPNRKAFQLRGILEGASDEPVLEDEVIEVRSQSVLFTFKVIKRLGAETKETNVMIRTALLTALICIENYGGGLLDEPLIHILLSYILEYNDYKALFKKFLKVLGFLEVDCFNRNGVTPLYKAIKNNNLDLVDALIQLKANCLKISQRNDTALHAAVDHPKILKYLVERPHCIPKCDSYNSKGYTAIHLAVISKKLHQFTLIANANALFLQEIVKNGKKNCLHLAVQHESVEIVEAIFKKLRICFGYRAYSKYKITSQEDESKNSPFHAALQGKNKDIIELFLRNGAFLSEIRHDGSTALEIIATQFNDASNILCDAFDDSISTNTTSGENRIDYSSFTDIKGTSQIHVIEQIVQCGQSDLLSHPLIQSYVYLKWNYFLPMFYVIISVHAIFLVTFNVLVANMFYYRDMTKGTVSTNQTSSGTVPWSQQELDWRYWTLITLMYTIITVLIVQEAFTIYIKRQQWRHHFADRETWMRLVFLVLAISLPVELACAEPADWQRHLACAALLLGWLQAMFLLSRFPSWGSYVLMFGTVAINILKILASMLFLIIGFSFCFMIQYRSTPPFNGPVAAFFKTLVMMSSEFDYEDLFGEDHAKELRDTILVVRLLFGLFVIFVAIVLMNFMTGAAVSDINELTVMAEKRRLEKQVQLLSTIEAIIYDGPFSRTFRKVFSLGRYYKQITYSSTKVTKWNLISVKVLEKDTELHNECEGVCENVINNTGTGSEMKIVEQPYEVRPSVKLNEAFIKIGRKKEWREEKNNVYITNNKIEELHNAFLDKPEDKKKGNKDWVHEAISKQEERIRSLAEDLQRVSQVNAQMMYCIEAMDSKIEKLISNQTQTSDSMKDLIVEIKKMAKEYQ